MSLPRILFINSTFPPHTLGGGPQIAGWLVEALRGLGHPVEVLCARAPHRLDTPGVHRILEPLGGWDTGRKTDPVSRTLQCAAYRSDRIASKRLLDAFQPDVLIAEAFFNITNASWMVAEERGIPTIFFPVSSYSPEQLYTSWGRLERLVFPLTGWFDPKSPDPAKLGALIAPSQFILDNYVEHGIAGRVRRVVPLGIPADRFSPTATPRGEETKILWLGRVTPGKGYDVALDALKLLRASGERVSLTLAGFAHPSDEILLQAAIRDRGLADQVARVRIPLDDEEGLIACYREHDIFWLTSLMHEALSLTLLEAMACGLPVIATEVGGNNDVIQRSGGVVGVPPGDAAALAAATTRMTRAPAERDALTRAAVAYIQAHHSSAGMARRFSEVIAEVTALPDLPLHT